jgi:hypothetical protein
MTEQQPKSFDALWRESIENHVGAMSDTDFADLVSRTRQHTATTQTQFTTSGKDLSDPADRQREILASIQGKQQRLKPKPEDVNANGYRKDTAGGPVNFGRRVNWWDTPQPTTNPTKGEQGTG